MSVRPATALILAAGMGSRLGPAYDARPKGFLEVDGVSLIARSVRLLQDHGMRQIVLVVGFEKEAYQRFARATPGVECVENPEFADSGTLASLECGLRGRAGSCLLLESDLFYEPRALSALLDDPREELLLASGFTGAGDEVWVSADGGRLRGLSKDRQALESIDGEFVGICKLSARLAGILSSPLTRELGPRASYETDALAAAAGRLPIGVLTLPDLRWGEVDDPAQLRRVRDQVAPSIDELEPRRDPTKRASKLLFTPGPLTTSPSVKQAMMVDLGSRDAQFLAVVKRVRKGLLAVVEAAEPTFAAVLLPGSGTYAIEALLGTAIANGKLLALVNGAYGARLADIAKVLGIATVRLEVEETVPIDPDRVEAALRADASITHVALVHCETSTGLVNPVEAIGARIADLGRAYIVDAMSSCGGIPLSMATAKIDYLVASANKCLQGVPGFAFVIARRGALERSRGFARSVSLDLGAQLDELDRSGQFRFTPPTHAILAAERALDELWAEGGVRARAERYRRNHDTLIEGMAGLGFRTLLPRPLLSHIITSFRYPAERGFDFGRFYQGLSERGFVIYPGKISRHETFRIGTIGAIEPSDVSALVRAVGSVLAQLDVHSPIGSA